MNFIKKWWDKFEDWMDEEEEEETPVEELVPPDSGIKRLIWNSVVRFESWAKKRRPSPFVVEFIIQIFVSAFYMIVFTALALLCFGIYYLFVGSIDQNFLLVVLILSVIPSWFGLLLHLILFPMLPLSLMDSISSKGIQIRKMSFTLVRPFTTSLDYIWNSTDLRYIFDREPCPCKWYYFELGNKHESKTSKTHQPPFFYQDKFRARGNEREFVRFIMTIKKSKLIDRLYRLEPTMAFEVTYLRFSKFLKEIRPIEGYEYAEGVEEILDKINGMYP